MSRIAFLFPGQGVQRVGMARDLYTALPEVQDWMHAASEAAGVDLVRLCFEGPEEELTRTRNAQPAILAASVAALIALRKSLREHFGVQGSESPTGNATTPFVWPFPFPHFVAGLSLGEYTALVCAGALSPMDAVRLVRQRGIFMEEAGASSSGTMASVIGLDRERVRAACQEAGGLVVAANYNAPGQIVISGEADAVARASERAKQYGARFVRPLKVSGAFHSPLMEPAAQRLSAVLEQTPLQDARVPVVANVTGNYVQTASEIRAALAAQVTGSVLWEDSVRRMATDGATTFVEIGPGQVLSGLVRRIVPEGHILQAEDVEGVAALAERLVLLATAA